MAYPVHPELVAAVASVVTEVMVTEAMGMEDLDLDQELAAPAVCLDL